ncbi:MAG: M23 family metallopeptidase [Sphingomonadales bacterium]
MIPVRGRIVVLMLVVAFMAWTPAPQSARADGNDTRLTLDGDFVQGGMIRGDVTPGASVTLDGREVRVDRWGRFVFGFGRDADGQAALRVVFPSGQEKNRTLTVARRDFKVQRIDGLPQRMVTPPEEVLERIRRENALIAAARARDTDAAWFRDGFIRPAEGRYSGIYGSQRILNGEPRQPHFGLDIAGPTGAPVLAPAPGIISLSETDLYYTGGTVMIDHGHGITSVLMHLHSVDVEKGARVEAGDRIGTIGATGRATGPHLDWRVNWFEVRLDPGLLLDDARDVSAPILD